MHNKGRIRRGMNSAIAGIDIGEMKSDACYLAPDGDVRDQFEFSMNPEGFDEFVSRVPRETRIAFEASGLAYMVSGKLRDLGYCDITIAQPERAVMDRQIKEEERSGG